MYKFWVYIWPPKTVFLKKINTFLYGRRTSSIKTHEKWSTRKIIEKTGVFYGNFWHSWGFKLAVSGRKDLCWSIKNFWHSHTPKKHFPTILEQKQHLKWSNKKKLPPPRNHPIFGGGVNIQNDRYSGYVLNRV